MKQLISVEANIFQSRYISPSDIAPLKSLGITHILNLTDCQHLFLDELIESGFVVKHIYLEDCVPIDNETAVEIVDYIHESVRNPENKIYVHCIAGINRSPTAIWLYLLSKGYSEQDAAAKIMSGQKNLVVPDVVLVSILNLDLIKNRHNTQFRNNHV